MDNSIICFQTKNINPISSNDNFWSSGLDPIQSTPESSYIGFLKINLLSGICRQSPPKLFNYIRMALDIYIYKYMNLWVFEATEKFTYYHECDIILLRQLKIKKYLLFMEFECSWEYWNIYIFLLMLINFREYTYNVICGYS